MTSATRDKIPTAVAKSPLIPSAASAVAIVASF
jgi:hypothetical protein